MEHRWGSSRTQISASHLFVKDQIWSGLVFGVKEDRPLQTKPGDEDDDCILPHKQNKALLVQDASALEE